MVRQKGAVLSPLSYAVSASKRAPYLTDFISLTTQLGFGLLGLKVQEWGGKKDFV